MISEKQPRPLLLFLATLLIGNQTVQVAAVEAKYCVLKFDQKTKINDIRLRVPKETFQYNLYDSFIFFIKRRISSIANSRIHFFYRDTKIERNVKLGTTTVPPGSEKDPTQLKVKILKAIRVIIKNGGNEPQVIIPDVDISHTIQQIKTEIKNKTGITPDEQILLVNDKPILLKEGQYLKKDPKIADKDMQKEVEIELKKTVKISLSFREYRQNRDQRKSIKIGRDSKVGDLIRVIDLINPIKGRIVSFDGKQITEKDKDKELCELGIIQGSELIIYNKLDYKIIIEHNSDVLIYNLRSTSTLKHLKKVISDKFMIDIDEYSLNLVDNGVYIDWLDFHEDLRLMGVQTNLENNQKFILEKKGKITIVYNGKAFSYSLKENRNLYELQKAIEREFSVNIDEQILLDSNGIQLLPRLDQKLVKDLRLKDKDILHLTKKDLIYVIYKDDTFLYPLKGDPTLKNLKDEIQKRFSINLDEHILALTDDSLNGFKELLGNNSNLVTELGLKADDQLVVAKKEKITIQYNEESFSYLLTKFSILYNLQSEIENQFDISIDDQILTFSNGSEIRGEPSSELVGDLKLKNNNVLIVTKKKQITVRYEGQTFQYPLKGDLTLKDLKLAIATGFNIKVDEYTLTLDRDKRELSGGNPNDNLVSVLKLRADDKLVLAKKEQIIIRHKRESFKYPLTGDPTLQELKTAIKSHFRVNLDNYVLSLSSGKELLGDDTKTKLVSVLGLKKDDELKLTQKNKLTIKYEKKYFSYPLTKDTNLKQLKDKIESEFGIELDKHTLTLDRGKRELLDSDNNAKLVSGLDLRNKDILKIHKEVIINYSKQPYYKISFDSSTKLKDLKKKIRSRFKIKEEQQILAFKENKGKELSGDTKLLVDLSIEHKSILELTEKAPPAKSVVTYFNPYANNADKIIRRKIDISSKSLKEVRAMLKKAKISKHIEIRYEGNPLADDDKKLSDVFDENKPYVLYLYNPSNQKKEDKDEKKISTTAYIFTFGHFLLTVFLGRTYLRIRKKTSEKATEKTKTYFKLPPRV